LILASFSLHGQNELPRKAHFGARLGVVDQGVLIEEVVSGTALSLKLQKNDVILEINEVKIANYDDFLGVFQTKKEGDLAVFLLERNKKIIKVKGRFVGRPFESSSFSKVIYDQAAFRGGQLRVIINKPDREEKMPALLFIPGYTCSSIDNLSDNHPYKRIIDVFAKAGFVTLRVEKSGLGDSRNTPECESCDLFDEIENFQVGLDKLKSLPYVDSNRVIIFGHSMGGIVAPALSAKNSVAGVIVYGTTAKSWFEYQIEMYRTQNLLAGMDPLEYEKSIVDQYDLVYRFFVKDESLADLAQNPHLDSLLREQWMYDGQGKIFSRNAEYWRQIQSMNHLEHWKNTKAKVLVLFGESDFQAFSLADHQQIVRTVNYYSPGNALLLSFPQTDHYFAKSGTMQEAYDKFVNQQYLELFDAYNFEVGSSVLAWSLEVIGTHPTK
jgi:pimeloyl-ACP methyl ester carboxylesterase